MKKHLPYFPVLVLVIITTLWLRRGSSERAALQSAIATLRAAHTPPPPADARALPASDNKARTLTKNNAALRAQLQQVEAAMNGMQKETAALQKTIPPLLAAEVTESFGRITDMGAELGQYCRLISSDPEEVQNELKRRGLNADELSDSVVKAYLKFTTWGPVISAFEDTPADIASLQSTALREAFALTDTQTQQAETIIKAHFTAMKTAGLTYSSHDTPEWRERRSSSLTQLLWQLRPLLPANSKQIPHLSQIINLGAGIETRTIAPAPGESEPQLVQSFPNWPVVPWLPAKPGK